jgi:hypothetical protein
VGAGTLDKKKSRPVQTKIGQHAVEEIMQGKMAQQEAHNQFRSRRKKST